jgi:hypothetical protein
MYYEIILKPIDLTIIRTKLDNGDYFSYQSFEEDLLLLFTNAIVGVNICLLQEIHLFFSFR